MNDAEKKLATKRRYVSHVLKVFVKRVLRNGWNAESILIVIK